MIFFIAIVVMALFLCALLPDNNPSGAIMRILIFLAVLLFLFPGQILGVLIVLSALTGHTINPSH